MNFVAFSLSGEGKGCITPSAQTSPGLGEFVIRPAMQTGLNRASRFHDRFMRVAVSVSADPAVRTV